MHSDVDPDKLQHTEASSSSSRTTHRPFTDAEIAHYMALAWDQEVGEEYAQPEFDDVSSQCMVMAPPDEQVPLPSLTWQASSSSSQRDELLDHASTADQGVPPLTSSSSSPGTANFVAPPDGPSSSTSVCTSPPDQQPDPPRNTSWWYELRDRRPLRGIVDGGSTPWWIAIQDTRGIARLRQRGHERPSCARNPSSFLTDRRPPPGEQQDWDAWLAESTSDEEPGVTSRFGQWRVGRDRWHRPNGSIIVRQRERLQAEGTRPNLVSPMALTSPGFQFLVLPGWWHDCRLRRGLRPSHHSRRALCADWWTDHGRGRTSCASCDVLCRCLPGSLLPWPDP